MKTTQMPGDLREVVKRILRRDLARIKNKNVLEIGCGTWDYAKRIVEKNNCKWHGFEPIDEGEKNITIVKGSVKNIPFHKNSFDLIICNQTMEHWFEYGVSFKRALSEIKRVLIPNGLLMINVPIHVHGHPLFLRGKLEKIMDLFERAGLRVVLFEKCIPGKKEKRWRKISNEGWKSKLKYPDFLIPKANQSYSYILNIHVKNNKRHKEMKEVSALYSRPVAVILRFVRALFLG